MAVDVLGGLPDHGDDSGSLSRAAPPCFPGSRDLPSFANLQGCVMLPLSRVLLPRPCKPPAYLIVWPWFTSVCPTPFTDIGERERQGNDGLFVTRGYHLAGRSWTQLDVPVPTWKASTGCAGTVPQQLSKFFQRVRAPECGMVWHDVQQSVQRAATSITVFRSHYAPVSWQGRVVTLFVRPGCLSREAVLSRRWHRCCLHAWCTQPAAGPCPARPRKLGVPASAAAPCPRVFKLAFQLAVNGTGSRGVARAPRVP